MAMALVALVYIEPITDNMTNTKDAASPPGPGISRGGPKPAGIDARIGPPTGGAGGSGGGEGSHSQGNQEKDQQRKKKEIVR